MPELFYQNPIPMHHDIDRLLKNKDLQFLDIIAPRGHAKSAIISNAHPANEILSSHFEHNGRKEFVLIISKTSRVAEELLGAVKYNLNYSQPLIDIYGHWGEKTAKEWTKDRIVLWNDSLAMARGIGQHITGIRHLEIRPTIAIVDDPQDRDNTKTEGAMEAHLSWLLGELVPAMDPFRGRIILVGTPKHELCLVEVLAKNPMWTKVRVTLFNGETANRYDAIVNEETHEVLWPARHSYEKLMALQAGFREDGKLSLFYSEYRCQIVGSEEQLFRPEDMMYYRGKVEVDPFGQAFLHLTHISDEDFPGDKKKLTKLDVPDIRPVNLFMGVDPASSVKKSSAWSVVMVVAVDNLRNIFILPYFRKHTTPTKLTDAIEERWNYYKESIRLVNIETVGYQEMIRDELRNKRKLYMPGLHKKHSPRQEKSARLERLEPYSHDHRLYLQPDMTELEGELFLYPRSGTYDLMDALDLATDRIFIPSHGVPEALTEVEMIERIMHEDVDTDWMLA